MKFNKAAAVVGIIAGISLIGACGDDDSSADTTGAQASTSVADNGGAQSNPGGDQAGIPPGYSAAYPDDFPADVPRLSGKYYTKTSAVNGSVYTLGIGGLQAGDFDKAVETLKAAGFKVQGGIFDDGNQKSAALVRGGIIASLVGGLEMGSQNSHTIIYTIQKTGS